MKWDVALKIGLGLQKLFKNKVFSHLVLLEVFVGDQASAKPRNVDGPVGADLVVVEDPAAVDVLGSHPAVFCQGKWALGTTKVLEVGQGYQRF